MNVNNKTLSGPKYCVKRNENCEISENKNNANLAFYMISC